MKQKMKARLKYNKNWNGKEGYVFEIDTDGNGWEFESFVPLVSKDGQSEANFVHFSIINKLAQLQAWGYEVTIR